MWHNFEGCHDTDIQPDKLKLERQTLCQASIVHIHAMGYKTAKTPVGTTVLGISLPMAQKP